ncbi:lipid-A-disaccharide synthase [Thermosulfuriphilus sp.]
MDPGLKSHFRIAIVAGEASGDLHGAAFIRAIRDLCPGTQLVGIGGEKMIQAGCEVLFEANRLAVVGLSEILPRLRDILRAFLKMRAYLRQSRPDLLVLIDFPEFNLLLARVAKRCGIPVFYYISPQVWAWREGRVRVIKRLVDMMAVILPFEEEFYRRHGIKVHYVGHPLLDLVQVHLCRETFFKILSFPVEKRLVSILPGSRIHEVRSLLPIFSEAYRQLRKDVPDLLALCVRAPGVPGELYAPALSAGIKVVEGYTYEAMAAAELALVASGTVTLEAAIVGVPMVIAYQLNPLTYFLARRLVKVPYIGLVNLVAGERLAPELIQDEATPERVAEEARAILLDQAKAERIRRRLSEIKASLGPGQAAYQAANLALNLVSRKR